MNEEKKEIKSESGATEKPKAAEDPNVAAKQPEVPVEKPVVEAKAEAAPAGAPEAPKNAEAPATAAAPKKERPSNCAGCNKSIKKKRWYYRDGKYYCTKRCWKTTLKKDEKKEAPQETKQ